MGLSKQERADLANEGGPTDTAESVQADRESNVMLVFGNSIDRSIYNPRRSILMVPEVTGAGNLILRVGRENTAIGDAWCQTEHVVLTPTEALNLISALSRAYDQSIAVRQERAARASA